MKNRIILPSHITSFACALREEERAPAKLADVLGHSSINTTRIYLLSTGTEHVRQMEKLNLVT